MGRQIAAYLKQSQSGTDEFSFSVGKREIVLEIPPFVANPRIMNSGLQVVRLLEARPWLVRNKRVVDMGTGSGIIGISASLLGAHMSYMSDIDEHAVDCARLNIKKNNLPRCAVFWSNLFLGYNSSTGFDVQIFNHPFFTADPLLDKPWTRMMCGGTDLIGRYFEQAPKFSTSDARYILPWMPLAGNKNRIDNDPGKRGQEYGFEVEDVVESEPVEQGLQQSQFVIYVLRHNG